MREYAKIAPQFWIGETGRQIRVLGPEVQVVALYLVTSPHANMLGLYYLPIPLLSHETGISTQGASKALASLSEAGFCAYDEVSECIWVYEMARYQVGEELKPNDNRVIGINRDYQSLPNNMFLKEFYDKYAEVFHLKKPRGFQGPQKGLRSQEQEKEQEKEKPPCIPPRGESSRVLPENSNHAKPRPPHKPTPEASEILGYLNTTLGRHLEDTSQIQALLKTGKTIEQCKLVVDYLWEVDRLQNPDGFEKYADNVTPFRPKNFDRLRDKAERWRSSSTQATSFQTKTPFRVAL